MPQPPKLALALRALQLHEPDPGEIAVDRMHMEAETPFPFVRASPVMERAGELKVVSCGR